MGKQASAVRGAGQKRKGTVDEKDADPCWLSLGSIYSSAAAAAAPASASPTLAGESCTPVTPTLPERPVSQDSVDVLGTLPSAATTHLPAGNASVPASATVLHGSGNGAFLATSVLTPTQLASYLLFPGDGNGAVSVPIAGDGNVAVQVTVPLSHLPTSSPCIRLSLPSTTLPAKEGAAAAALPLLPSNSQLQLHYSSPRPPQRSSDVSSSSSGGGSASSSDAPQHPASSNGDPPANNGTGARSSETPADTDLLESPPFPWATNRVAVHHSFTELCSRGITTVEGEVECRRCHTHKTVSYNIEAKFKEVADFILSNIHDMDDRAPTKWRNPTLPDCDGCSQKNSLKPVIPAEKEKINWMFLLLGQTLGLCTLDQLKHFCAHTKQHRTGAKDRVLYSTYMELCNQLFPNGPFGVNGCKACADVRYVH